MKKIRKYLGLFVAIITLFTIGIIVGSKLENNRQEKINGNLYNSVKVAVVNLDEGAFYNNEQRNFAKEILENYLEDYVITGLSDAKSGLDEGRYAAYVILPADFSANVVSINTMPNKSLLKYEISGDLSQLATDKAWQNVMKLKEKLNDDIGYVYVSSILNEFHNGQDNALKVLSNDSKDKEVIMAISNLDLVATLDLREVERLQNDIEDLDINSDIEKNAAIIATIDEAYKSYLKETSTQLDSLKNESTIINDEYVNVNEASNKIKNLINDDGSKNYSLVSTLEKLRQYNDDLNTNIINIFDELSNAVNNEKNDHDKYINEARLNLDVLIQNLDNNHEKIATATAVAINNNISKLINHINEDEFTIDFSNYPAIKNILDQEEKQKLLDKAEYYIDKAIIKTFTELEFIDSTPESKEALIELVEVNLSTDLKVHECLKIYAASIGIEEPEIADYNIKEYIETNDILFNDLINQDINQDYGKLIENVKLALEDDVKNTIIKNNNGLLKNIDKIIKDQPINTIKLNEEINNYKNEINNVPIFNDHFLKDKINAVEVVNLVAISNKIDEDLVSLAQEQTANKKQLIENIIKHEGLYKTFYKNLHLYDPLDAIDQDEIETYVNDYQINNSNTKSKIVKKNQEYIKFVSNSYDNANQQVSSMKEDISKYQQESDTKVTNGLSQAKAVKDETSNSNNELMDSFINKLLYTRIGSVANNEAYDLIVAPSNIEGNKLKNTTNASTIDYIKLFVTISGSSLIIWLAIRGLELMKNKNEKENKSYHVKKELI